MRRVLVLAGFLQSACGGSAFVVGWDLHSDGGEALEASDDARFSSTIDRQMITDAEADAGADAEADTTTDVDADEASSLEASLLDAPSICTAIPFAARSNCPTATGCSASSCSDPLLYAPSDFWLECSSKPTPRECQCAETYNCACLVQALGPTCKGTLLCDSSAAAPALFLRCVPGPDF